jgi:hypothetical protein
MCTLDGREVLVSHMPNLDANSPLSRFHDNARSSTPRCRVVNYFFFHFVKSGL